MQAYGSPLSNYAQDFIQISDATNTDWTLLASVAFAESSAGKKECGQFNPFGWGNPCWDFVDYPTAIRAIATSISSSPAYRRYQETHDITDLARIYNGQDVEKWIATVTGYQKKIRAFN